MTACTPSSPSSNKTSTSFAGFDARASAGGRALTVVFFGGSLTWGANASDPQKTSYRALMSDYLRQKYPKAPFTFIDASIGGTGSKLGMFRLERDVMAYHPDLVFLDFTANDGIAGEDPKSISSYESLLRRMIGAGVLVEQVYFGFKFNFGSSYNLANDPGYRQRRELAHAYQTAAADLYTYLQPKLVSGELNIDKLWSVDHGQDGAHPDDSGYKVFFEAARDGYEDAIKNDFVCRVPDKSVYPDEYRQQTRLRIVNVTLPAGWSREMTYRTSAWFDGLSSRWMGDVAVCDLKNRSKIQPLKIDFTGTMIGVFGESDENGLGFKASVDGKLIPFQPNPHTPPVDTWPYDHKGLGKGRLFSWLQLSDKLPPGKHTLEIDPVFPPNAQIPQSASAPLHQLRIESICFAGP